MRRTPMKRGNKPLKKSRWDRTKHHFAKDSKELFTFFIGIWDKLTVKQCWSCRKDLSSTPRSYYFDHLIEKSKRPDLAMEPENIFICCLECHALKTDGHPTEEHKEAIEKAEKKFGLT